MEVNSVKGWVEMVIKGTRLAILNQMINKYFKYLFSLFLILFVSQFTYHIDDMKQSLQTWGLCLNPQTSWGESILSVFYHFIVILRSVHQSPNLRRKIDPVCVLSNNKHSIETDVFPHWIIKSAGWCMSVRFEGWILNFIPHVFIVVCRWCVRPLEDFA